MVRGGHDPPLDPSGDVLPIEPVARNTCSGAGPDWTDRPPTAGHAAAPIRLDGRWRCQRRQRRGRHCCYGDRRRHGRRRHRYRSRVALFQLERDSDRDGTRQQRDRDDRAHPARRVRWRDHLSGRPRSGVPRGQRRGADRDPVRGGDVGRVDLSGWLLRPHQRHQRSTQRSHLVGGQRRTRLLHDLGQALAITDDDVGNREDRPRQSRVGETEHGDHRRSQDILDPLRLAAHGVDRPAQRMAATPQRSLGGGDVASVIRSLDQVHAPGSDHEMIDLGNRALQLDIVEHLERERKLCEVLRDGPPASSPWLPLRRVVHPSTAPHRPQCVGAGSSCQLGRRANIGSVGPNFPRWTAMSYGLTISPRWCSSRSGSQHEHEEAPCRSRE